MRVETTAQQLLFNTVPIEIHDENGDMMGSGTSFAMSHTFPDYGEELFLVTNKHVVEGGFTGYLYFTEVENGIPNIGKPFFVKNDPFFEIGWHGHPLEDVDVTVMPISWMLEMMGQDGSVAFLKNVSTSIIPDAAYLNALDALEDILFIGYPNGMFDKTNYTPILRVGTTATPVQLDWEGRPIFLIDASVFPGSSGSPVFYLEQSPTGRRNAEPKLLGIVSAVFFRSSAGDIELVPAPTTVVPIAHFQEMIDLGVVFKSHLILETIQSFWEKHGDKMLKSKESDNTGPPSA